MAFRLTSCGRNTRVVHAVYQDDVRHKDERPLISRSLHTQQLSCRAARRLTYPHASRNAAAALLSGRASGDAVLPFSPHADSIKNSPRIHAQKPLPGFVQPLTPGDIRAFLNRLGPEAVYGLRVIRLHSMCLWQPTGVVFGEYVVPGEIHLYALPPSPWRFACLLSQQDCDAFIRHGAILCADEYAGQTTVAWTWEGLKTFLLYEVLAHEIGHHRLQQHKGKRRGQVCRRADHEAGADLYSRRVHGRLSPSVYLSDRELHEEI